MHAFCLRLHAPSPFPLGYAPFTQIASLLEIIVFFAEVRYYFSLAPKLVLFCGITVPAKIIAVETHMKVLT